MKSEELKKNEDVKKEDIITNDEAQTLEGGVAEVQSSAVSEPVVGDGKAAICCVGNKKDELE